MRKRDCAMQRKNTPLGDALGESEPPAGAAGQNFS